MLRIRLPAQADEPERVRALRWNVKAEGRADGSGALLFKNSSDQLTGERFRLLRDTQQAMIESDDVQMLERARRALGFTAGEPGPYLVTTP
jgi:hypothetical protein